MQMMPVFTVNTPHLKGLRERESKQMSEMNEHRNRYAPEKKHRMIKNNSQNKQPRTPTIPKYCRSPNKKQRSA